MMLSQKKIAYRYNTFTGELTSFRCEDSLEASLYLDVTHKSLLL